MKQRRSVFTVLLVTSLLLFEMFSYSSSYEALYGMIGMAQWSALIAFSLCAVDFAGLGRILLPGDRMPKDSWSMLFVAWLLSALGDTFLTYLVVAHNMRLRASEIVLVSSGMVSFQTWTVTIPIAFAILVWLIQVMLVTGFDRLMGSNTPSKPSRRQKSPEYPTPKLT